VPKSTLGLLAELADAMDSKSVASHHNHTVKPAKSQNDGKSCAEPCATPASDPDTAALTALLPKLSAKQRRQLLALARSMVD
jgi:hypothetical protein